ncbi:MAG: LLM class F420-dependent oxidoreductase [Actinomycetota bacterium]|nr:LLM class F420-dependent oxidoreductase [Actinomycetota bacterium]
MRLGINLGYWGAGGDADALELAKEADRLGFAVAWAAEAYGSDAVTVLTWVAAHTERMDVGSAVFQIPARTPAMTAMTAATLDTLSGGRFRLGLGLSGPQVSEGWHGVRYGAPMGRTREYIDIVQMALRRDRVDYHGKHFELPLPDGPGKALKLTVHPVRDSIPIYLAAIGPQNLELAGEKADGWLAIFYSPEHAAESLASIRAGAEKVGRDLGHFDVVPTMPLSVGDDVAACAEPVRGYAALYVGGMGSREKNFYNALARRMGYDEAATEIQDRYLSGDKAGAAAAVPLKFVDETSLLGPKERIAERMTALADSGVTTLTVSSFAGDLAGRIAAIRTAAEALDAAGVGD